MKTTSTFFSTSYPKTRRPKNIKFKKRPLIIVFRLLVFRIVLFGVILSAFANTFRSSVLNLAHDGVTP